ncbi:RibD family protein [Amaricoccus solimangrovi]|uniref:RibD family protein n=1 Tax=Amaricoccus solimangrovi TaxID=2589815 RepID=A0A501X0H6_9RHOB|nr:RibD family protein [Amaricoccus solimangrovi]TPE53201.1 RibD family protein [Amaricoccus solimangrovi]
MRQAEVTEGVWSTLLGLREGARRAPGPDWSAAERAAWDLYAPIAGGADPGPYFFAQVGQSIDGRVATVSGDAADVSGHEGLCHLHRCRALADAVVIGVRTALADNPRLTVRHVPGRHPVRVVLDPRGRLPDEAGLLSDASAHRIVIQSVPRRRPDGVEVITLPSREHVMNPRAIRDALLARGLRRVLVEGGGTTIAHFLEAGLLDRLHVGVAPLIIGAGPSGLRTSPIDRLSQALRPRTAVYGLDTDVIFDCALDPSGSASRSTWPTTAEEIPPAIAASRA